MKTNKVAIVGMLLAYLGASCTVTCATQLPDDVQRKLRVSFIALRGAIPGVVNPFACMNEKKQILSLQNLLDMLSEIFVPAIDNAMQHKHVVAPLSTNEHHELVSSLSCCTANAPEFVRFRKACAERIRTNSSGEAEDQEFKSAVTSCQKVVENLLHKVDILAEKHGGKNRFFFGPKLDA